MHILLLGGTGQIGKLFIDAALSAGHTITIYARNPSKLRGTVRSDDRVEIVQGTFEDSGKLEEFIVTAQRQQHRHGQGKSVLVSVAGPLARISGMPVTRCYELLFPLLLKYGSVQRAVVLATPSFPAKEDKRTRKWDATRLLIRVVGGTAFHEISGMGGVVTAVDVERIQWTLFRVGFLGNGEAAEEVKAGFEGDGYVGMKIDRKSVVKWILEEMESGKWIGRCPIISN